MTSELITKLSKVSTYNEDEEIIKELVEEIEVYPQIRKIEQIKLLSVLIVCSTGLLHKIGVELRLIADLKIITE